MFHEPIGISASYASAIESVLAGLIPNIASCCMMKTHFAVFVCFIGWKVIEGIELHSGYAFPYSPFTFIPFPVTERHDFHHTHNSGCYGGWFWDWICGTDKTFKEFKSRKKLVKCRQTNKKVF
jgi:sterol desaturase/sphingolipid hydroxylase (fatty acid hydroxylase superfamily)